MTGFQTMLSSLLMKEEMKCLLTKASNSSSVVSIIIFCLLGPGLFLLWPPHPTRLVLSGLVVTGASKGWIPWGLQSLTSKSLSMS